MLIRLASSYMADTACRSGSNFDTRLVQDGVLQRERCDWDGTGDGRSLRGSYSILEHESY